jgi:hypothetical protein
MPDILVLVCHFPDRHLPGHQVLDLQLLDRRVLDLLDCEWEVVLRCTRARDRKFTSRKLTVQKDHLQKIADESRH